MDYKNIKTILCLILALVSVEMRGQETQVDDSTLVSVAYKQVHADDLLSGVSYYNVSEVMEKNDLSQSGDSRKLFLPGLNGDIWGSEGLILIDGFPRDLGNIVASEIEQITVLKGIAAVALYGSQGAKGVTLVTTKRGKAFKNEIKVRANTGVFVPKPYPEYLGSAEYMLLYNESRTNDGQGPLYDNTDIKNYALGQNRYRYPDVDYYSSDYLRSFTNRHDVTGEFSGGNDRAQYYVNMGYYSSNTLLNIGNAKDESDNRFHLRGNLDMKINSFISAQVNTSITNYNTVRSRTNHWENAATIRPNWFTPLLPISSLDENVVIIDQVTGLPQDELITNNPFIVDGKYILGGNQQQTENPFAPFYALGHTKYTARQYHIVGKLNFDLSSLVQGLGFYAQLGTDYYSRYNLDENINDYAIYEPEWNDDGVITTLTRRGNNMERRARSLYNSYGYQKLMFNGVFTYGRTFDYLHNVSGLLLASGYQQTLSQTETAEAADILSTYQKPTNTNLGLQLGYNYAHKYYVDFTGAMIHSKKLPDNRRNAFSPTVSAGWRISGEDFMSGVSFVDNLKLTASAGIVNQDMDVSGYYLYKERYIKDGSYQHADGFSASATVNEFAESDFGFIQRKEINVGLEAELFDKFLKLNMSAFNIRMNGMLVRDGNIFPGYYSYGNSNLIPYENFNENLYKGFDFGLTLNKKINDLNLQLGAIGTYSTGEAYKRSENYAYDYQTRMGKPLNHIWGLQSDGLFMDQRDVQHSPNQTFGTVMAGDIKYIDQNGDGVINSDDEVYLGRSTAPFAYALNFTANWKGFTFFMLWNGQLGGNAIKSNDYYRPGLERKYSVIARERTTLKTDADGNLAIDQLGTFPRLSVSNTNNNFRNSDYWMYSTDYINLAQVQLTYALPKSILERTFMKEVGFYVRGSNLLTIASERKIMETNIGSSPSSRFFNLGATVTF